MQRGQTNRTKTRHRLSQPKAASFASARPLNKHLCLLSSRLASWRISYNTIYLLKRGTKSPKTYTWFTIIYHHFNTMSLFLRAILPFPLGSFAWEWPDIVYPLLGHSSLIKPTDHFCNGVQLSSSVILHLEIDDWSQQHHNPGKPQRYFNKGHGIIIYILYNIHMPNRKYILGLV